MVEIVTVRGCLFSLIFFLITVFLATGKVLAVSDEPGFVGGAFSEKPYPEEPYPEEPYPEEPYPEEPYSEEPYPEEPYSEEPYSEEAYSEEPYSEEPYPEEPYPEEPYSEEPYLEELLSEEDPFRDSFESALEAPDSLSDLKSDVLNNIHYLADVLRQHSGSVTESGLLHGLATGMAVTLLDGATTTLLSRLFSVVMADQSSFMQSLAANSAYSAFSMGLAWQLLHFVGLNNHRSLRDQLWTAIEAAGIGHVSGVLSWQLTNRWWSTLLELYPQGTGQRDLLNRFQVGSRVPRFSSLPLRDQLTYQSSTHYLVSKMLVSFGWYLLRSSWQERAIAETNRVVEDDLAHARERLRRIQAKEQRLKDKELLDAIMEMALKEEQAKNAT